MPPRIFPVQGKDELPNMPPPPWISAAAWALLGMIVILLLLSAMYVLPCAINEVQEADKRSLNTAQVRDGRCLALSR